MDYQEDLYMKTVEAFPSPTGVNHYEYMEDDGFTLIEEVSVPYRG